MLIKGKYEGLTFEEVFDKHRDYCIACSMTDDLNTELGEYTDSRTRDLGRKNIILFGKYQGLTYDFFYLLPDHERILTTVSKASKLERVLVQHIRNWRSGFLACIDMGLEPI